MKYLYLFFLIALSNKVLTNDLIFVLNDDYSVSQCEWIINNCGVDYITFWENNNSLTYNSSNKEIVNENITSTNSLRYKGLEIISNFDIPTLNYTYCVDYLCNNEKTKNTNNYRIVVIVISCILFILPVIATIYLFRNKTQNRIVQRQQQENMLNFNNEYYYRYNQNLYYGNDAFLNEDDDILYNQDHIYAEQDFDQL